MGQIAQDFEPENEHVSKTEISKVQGGVREIDPTTTSKAASLAHYDNQIETLSAQIRRLGRGLEGANCTILRLALNSTVGLAILTGLTS